MSGMVCPTPTMAFFLLHRATRRRYWAPAHVCLLRPTAWPASTSPVRTRRFPLGVLPLRRLPRSDPRLRPAGRRRLGRRRRNPSARCAERSGRAPLLQHRLQPEDEQVDGLAPPAVGVAEPDVRHVPRALDGVWEL